MVTHILWGKSVEPLKHNMLKNEILLPELKA